jgi:nicotinamidase/pyrazinamidase
MRALVVVDVQNDLCPGGALPVRDGHAVVPVIDRILDRFPFVVLTQDWHPPGHVGFASAHPGRAPFDTIELAYGTQVLWPDHCVQGSRGADFHAGLRTDRAHAIVRKGYHADVDSYSGFHENDRATTTGLHGLLFERGIQEVWVCGLAADTCVKWTALDAADLGYRVAVVEDAVRGVAPETVDAAWRELAEAGVRRVRASEA